MTDRESAVGVVIDRFYVKNGPCCAGCDWWRFQNSTAGECHRSAPMSSDQRIAMLGMRYASLPIGAGHPFTPREHVCGDFKDEFDWSTLPPDYLRRIGHAAASIGKTGGV